MWALALLLNVAGLVSLLLVSDRLPVPVNGAVETLNLSLTCAHAGYCYCW